MVSHARNSRRSAVRDLDTRTHPHLERDGDSAGTTNSQSAPIGTNTAIVNPMPSQIVTPLFSHLQTMTHIRQLPAEKLAKTLICRHAELGSWRDVASLYQSDLIKPGTLNRIAKSGGAWMPKKDIILIALGVMKQPKPEWLNIAVRFLREKEGKR
jgi:hypothetical protein